MVLSVTDLLLGFVDRWTSGLYSRCSESPKSDEFSVKISLVMDIDTIIISKEFGRRKLREARDIRR
jgi:hypothetical protein